MARKVTFEDACRTYTNRFTMEHVPEWAKHMREDRTFYAPQYRTDREWYERTAFHGEPGHLGFGQRECTSRDQTWPLGQALSAPYRKGN